VSVEILDIRLRLLRTRARRIPHLIERIGRRSSWSTAWGTEPEDMKNSPTMPVARSPIPGICG